jgi:hypothetical protein
MLGYPDQAEKRATESLTLARELGYPFTLSWCAQNLAMYHLIRHDFPRAEEMIREGLALAKEHRFAFSEQILVAYRVLGLAAQGTSPDRGEIERYAQAGFELSFTWALPILAEGFASGGRIDIALPLIGQSIGLVERNQERYVESEVFRIKGELLLRQIEGASSTSTEIRSAQSSAEQSFRKAIEVARHRNARMFEMRAAISLGRLLMGSGRRAEARPILQNTYDWFTEGFKTAELKTAGSLLEDLTLAPESGP